MHSDKFRISPATGTETTWVAPAEKLATRTSTIIPSSPSTTTESPKGPGSTGGGLTTAQKVGIGLEVSFAFCLVLLVVRGTMTLRMRRKQCEQAQQNATPHMGATAQIWGKPEMDGSNVRRSEPNRSNVLTPEMDGNRPEPYELR
ncbi:hypothetical protein H2198_003969 [Neophaeococcomyces mojaviensis]|uniref:Uncharacterized protein n=1 Tax=Neophaeococcomyces mojaviensis TaxID=3383035 RepID=A0ACC3AA79_9EURO|nr:hypothetical protein H2198_003969 [Knufia sp. JES_112]